MTHNKTKEHLIVTEETPVDNDKKPFKKIPLLCELMTVKLIQLPTMLKALSEIECQFRAIR